MNPVGIGFVIGVPMVLSIVIGLYSVSESWSDYKLGDRTTRTMKNMKYGWLIILSPFAFIFVPAAIVYGAARVLFDFFKVLFRGLGKTVSLAWKNFWILWKAVREAPDNDKVVYDASYIHGGTRYNKHGLPININGMVLYDHSDYDPYLDPAIQKQIRRENSLDLGYL